MKFLRRYIRKEKENRKTSKGDIMKPKPKKKITKDNSKEIKSTNERFKDTVFYISGPMTGYPDNNYPAFDAMEIKLKDNGYKCVNPSGEVKGYTYEQYLKRDISNLLECDGVVLLDGWEASKGANAELVVAKTIGLVICKAVETEDGFTVEEFDIGEQEDILSEAKRITSSDRIGTYGHPLDDYTRTAKIWSAILGTDVTPEQAILCMVGVKISRECNLHKRDNLVDGAGYFQCIEKLHCEKKRREAVNIQ
jgi:hypothetical protein